MTSQQTLDRAAINGAMSAAPVAMHRHATQSPRTVAIIRRALEALEANGIITVTDRDQWPADYVADPPYTIGAAR